MKIIAPYCALAIFCMRAAVAAEGAASNLLAGCADSIAPADASYQFLLEENPDISIGNTSRIGEIHYTRLPIFNEAIAEENNAVFRWANRFHILTRERIVSQQVLFEQGQEFETRILQESARLLRSQGYFYDAAIRPVRQCGEDIDVEVITKDNWSFTPSIAFDRSGGENTFSVGLRDSNILGLGKQLAIGNEKDIDRRSKELIYEDNNVLGSRIRNRTSLIDSDDGSAELFDLRLPFFSLDTRRSWAVRLENEEREDEQFFRGDDVTEVVHHIEDYGVEYGFSSGLQDGVARRWTLGYRYRSDKFSRSDELPPPTDFPIDKELSYPYVGFESIEDNYDTAFNLDQIYRTEDLYLGQRLLSRLGYAADVFGSDQDRLVLEGFFGDTLLYNDGILWQHSLEWQGLWNLDTSEAEDLVLTYNTRYFRRQTSRRSFFASLEAVYSKHLNTNRQIVLGGLTGARAFDNRFQVGDRSVILTLEQRIYTDIHLFNLIRVGGALFVDVGRAWEPGVDNGVEEELLADIGFGIRLASSKAASGRVAHIDFAFPVTNRNDPDVDSFQIALNIKGTF